ncbi:MAG: DUF2293 domain-containing protein [Lentisphaerae bacterium]|nr:DUF2293 domain-containing protein [Lentisphaerota bacterium]
MSTDPAVLTVRPGPRPRTVLDEHGRLLAVPADWDLLAPGDAGLTRRVKAAGAYWLVEVAHGRRRFSQGLWAPSATIAEARAGLERERSLPEYHDRRRADQRRREQQQGLYVAQFREAVLARLRFAACHGDTARRLAEAVAAQATPVGSGTVARTARLDLEDKAELALMAWMRHQTSDYDRRHIARIKGERREVRREIAQASRRILEPYRQGARVDAATCPLQQALRRLENTAGTGPSAAEGGRADRGRAGKGAARPGASAPPGASAAKGAWQDAFEGFLEA